MDATLGPAAFNLSRANVGLGLVFILLTTFLSAVLRLGVVISLIRATVKSMLQLANTNSLLEQLLKTEDPWIVRGAAFFLVFLGTCEAVINRSEKRYSSMFSSVLVSMLASTVPVWYIGARYAIAVDPIWTSKQYFLLLSMLCWNALLSLAVAVDCVLKEVYDNRDKVETYLAFGASRFEACSPIAREALRLALAPTINQMSLIGFISIPDIMAGAIIGGSSVEQAVKLQIIIMFMVSTSTTLAAVITTGIALLVVVDGEHRVRLDRIDIQQHAVLRILNWVFEWIAGGFKSLACFWRREKD